MSRWEVRFFFIACVAFFVMRFAWLSGPLDGHVSRQIWSAYPSQIMATEWPPEIFRTKMPFHGRDWITPGSFPIYELIVSSVYRLIGGPNLAAARLVNLLFFGFSAVYLFLCVRLIWRERVAWYATLFYLMLPLGLFYSRAVHYETQLLFFGLGYLYHGMAFANSRRFVHAVACLLLAIPGFLIKAPVQAMFVLPVFVWQWNQGPRQAKSWIFPLIVPALGIALGFWYYRYVMFTWHADSEQTLKALTTAANHQHLFGALMERFSPREWFMLVKKFERFLIPRELVFPVVLGLWALWDTSDKRQRLMTSALLAGIAMFVFALFTMLKRVDHEWYLLPMTIPVAICLGFAGDFVTVNSKRYRVGAMLLMALFLALSSAGVAKETQLFHLDRQINAAGEAAKQKIPEGDLVIFTGIGRSVWRTDSRLPYLSGRLGWSRKPVELMPEEVDKLMSKGAGWLAVVVTTDFPPPESLRDFDFLGREPSLHLLSEIDSQTSGWLVLYNLKN